MIKKLLFPAALTLLTALAVSCGKAEIPEGAVVLDGVYEAEAMPVPQVRYNRYPTVSGGDTYIMEWGDDGEGYISTGLGTRIKLPGVGVSIFHPDGDEILFYGSDKDREIYGLLEGDRLVWSVPVADFMNSPLLNKFTGDMGTLFLLHTEGFSYVVGANDIVVFDESGTALKHITTGAEVRTAFEYGGKVSVVTSKEHYVFTGSEVSDGPLWSDALNKYNVFGGTDAGTALAKSDDSVIKVNVGDLSSETLINFTNSGLLLSRLKEFVYESDDLLWCVVSTPSGKGEAYKLTRVGQRIIDRGHVINLVYLDTGNNPFGSIFGTSAYLFNKMQNDWFVRLLPFTGTDEEYDRYIDLTVISGGDCDLIEFKGDTGKYTSKNLCADLYDGVVMPDGLFSPIKKLYEREGQLPVVPLSFCVMGMLCDGTITDGCDGWTPGKLIEASGGYSPIKYYFPLSKGSDLLHLNGFDAAMFSMFMKNGFDRAAFLKFADFYNASLKPWPDEGSSPLEYFHILSQYNYLQTELKYRKEGKSFIGYPTADGGRFSVFGYEQMAVMKDAPSAEGAKRFLSYMLSCESAVSGGTPPDGIPSAKEGAVKYWDHYFSDISGLIVQKSTDKLFMVLKKESVSDALGRYEGEYSAVDQTLLDGYISFIDSIEPTEPMPSAVTDIISEELSAVGGGRSAEEIADILESRINIYLKEHN